MDNCVQLVPNSMVINWVCFQSRSITAPTTTTSTEYRSLYSKDRRFEIWKLMVLTHFSQTIINRIQLNMAEFATEFWGEKYNPSKWIDCGGVIARDYITHSKLWHRHLYYEYLHIRILDQRDPNVIQYFFAFWCCIFLLFIPSFPEYNDNCLFLDRYRRSDLFSQ